MFNGKTQLTRIWKVKPDSVEKMKENAESHTNWMKETHNKEGEKAHLMLNWCMESEKDEEGNETGNTLFVLTEVYETVAGVDDHFKQASETSVNFIPNNLAELTLSLTACDRGKIINSLW